MYQVDTNGHRKGNMKKLIILTAVLYSTANAWEPAEAPPPHVRELLAAVIIGEAWGEKREGWEALFEVMWQRVSDESKQWPNTYKGVVTQHRQFSCLNKHRTESKRIRYINGIKYSKDKQKRLDFYEVLEMVKLIPLTVHTCPKGQEKVIRNRSDHYFAHEKAKPSWSNGKGKVIGNHTFERHR